MDSNLLMKVATHLGAFAVGFAGGWVANDLSREAEAQAPKKNG